MAERDKTFATINCSWKQLRIGEKYRNWGKYDIVQELHFLGIESKVSLLLTRPYFIEYY